MAARQHVSRKAPASATRTPTSKKLEPRPFTTADQSQQAIPEKQISPQPEANLLSQVQVSPGAMVQPKLISSAGKAQSAQPTPASTPAPRVQREVTEKDLEEQLGIDLEAAKKVTANDFVNMNPAVNPVAG